MERSQNIARLAGPVLAVIGIGMLTNQAGYREMAGQFLTGLPFIYFSGILALVAGLAILNSHNIWTRDWRIVVSILGLMLTVGGMFRILAPQFVAYLGKTFVAHGGFFMGAGIVLLALGGLLTFKGYAT